MIKGFKPNLAAALTKPELIKFPVWASPKIDGIRCVVFGGVAYSRSLKPIPNEYVQGWVQSMYGALEGFDGELVVGSPTDRNCMQNSMAVMRRSGEPDFTFHVFDKVTDSIYDARQSGLEREFEDCAEFLGARVKLVPQRSVRNGDELAVLEARFLEDGYEGMMIRNGGTLYKFGRSTEREGGLVKVKRFVDAEAVIVGFEEEMHNANEATRDATGRTERSTAKAGLVGKGTLGALRVAMPMDSQIHDSPSIVFNVGTGFTQAQREEYWTQRGDLLGALVTFKYFDHGVKEAPRHPVFKSFRAKEDMS